MSNTLAGQLPDSCPESSAKVVRRASRQLCGELPDSCPESFPTAVRRASRQLCGELPDSCPEGFPTAVWDSFQTAICLEHSKRRFKRKSKDFPLEDLSKCLDRESIPGGLTRRPGWFPPRHYCSPVRAGAGRRLPAPTWPTLQIF